MIRVRVSYQGRVQGVGFRATARSVASHHPVTGWVRNEPDSSVTLEAQGAPTAVNDFLEDLRRTMARNIRAEARADLAAVPHESAFVIER